MMDGTLKNGNIASVKDGTPYISSSHPSPPKIIKFLLLPIRSLDR
jgi:hypothetical protein